MDNNEPLDKDAREKAWMAYADAQEIPHDHDDEEPFKHGFDAGYEYEPPDDPEFNKLLHGAIEDINDK